MLNHFRALNNQPEQQQRSIITIKVCFTNPDPTCAMDAKNNDCWCYKYCIEERQRYLGCKTCSIKLQCDGECLYES